jgi:hypothetical protein
MIFSIFFDKEKLKSTGSVTPWAVALGMIASWAMAIIGKHINDGNIVLFSPCASLIISFSIIGIKYIFSSPIPESEELTGENLYSVSPDK